MSIDLNCDLGEGCPFDAELMPLITSANIACGGHAGDAGSMRVAVELAAAHGVAIGAHPGFEDRRNFGRGELALPTGEIFILVTRQVRVLADVARTLGHRLAHVKPHGGLYNLAARDRRVKIRGRFRYADATPACPRCGRQLQSLPLPGSGGKRL